MPFLFVDYDHGAGGEYFCSCLSQAPEAEPLEFVKFDSGRTKIRDVFNQEFIKETPNLDIKLPTVGPKYNIVPSHRNTALAKQILTQICSVRIQRPVEGHYYKFFKHQQITKVLLANEPTDSYFFGMLKILAQKYNNTDFLSRVTRSMDNLSLTLLAQGIEPTDANRQQYIEDKFKSYVSDSTEVPDVREPDFKYDLTIPYETLFTDSKSIVDDLQQSFGITVDINLLTKYRKDFELYQAQHQTTRH
jgi:hypothetical protein